MKNKYLKREKGEKSNHSIDFMRLKFVRMRPGCTNVILGFKRDLIYNMCRIHYVLSLA